MADWTVDATDLSSQTSSSVGKQVDTGSTAAARCVPSEATQRQIRLSLYPIFQKGSWDSKRSNNRPDLKLYIVLLSGYCIFYVCTMSSCSTCCRLCQNTHMDLSVSSLSGDDADTPKLKQVRMQCSGPEPLEPLWTYAAYGLVFCTLGPQLVRRLHSLPYTNAPGWDSCSNSVLKLVYVFLCIQHHSSVV